MRLIFFMLLIFLFAGSLPVFAQDRIQADTLITVHIKDTPLRKALIILQSLSGLRFDYNPELIPAQKNITLDAVNIPLSQFLEILFRGTGLSYTFIGRGIVIRRQQDPLKITISGYVTDLSTNEWLIGASVVLPQLNISTVSNKFGFFSITIPAADSVLLGISYIGYKPRWQRAMANRDLSLSIDLNRSDEQEKIPQITLARDSREDNVKKNQSSSVDLNADMLTIAPSSGSNGDLINSIELLPGVQAGIEGTPGYSVRGGNKGQNIVLLDDACIYNPTHLFELVSIFNPDAVKYASFLKGGFPASYGDHISSVLDVSMKDGNNQAIGGTADAGTIASGLSLYGPLSPGHSSYFVSARRSTIDWWLQPFFANNYFSHYHFYDINAKLNFSLSRQDRLFISFYRGQDQNNYSRDSTENGGINYNMHFGNTVFSARWNHLLSKRIFSNTCLVYNHYQQFLSATQQSYFAQLYSGIRDLNVKTDWSYYARPEHKITAGADWLFQTLFPASVSDKISNVSAYFPLNPANIPQKNSIRATLYAGDDIQVSPQLRLYIGLRVPLYHTQEIQYLHAEPRLSLLYLINDLTSIKASYSRMHQYIHLVQSYNASFPAEIWIGSSPLVRPQASDEYTAGIFRNFKENSIQASLEFYYKDMQHQSLFKGATSPAIDNSIENKLIFGEGWSYGAEWMIRKNSGRWKGWLAYSFAYAWQQFDSLNKGQRFPFALDRRHSLSLSASYAIDAHWKASASFFLTSGRAFTLNNNKTGSSNNNPLYEDDREDDGSSVPSTQQETNNYRLTPYNRLDLGLSYKKNRLRHSRLWQTTWALTVYNVYAHYNTEFAFRTIDPVTQKATATQVSFIPVIPTLIYSVTF